jgi:hypothetical protein
MEINFFAKNDKKPISNGSFSQKMTICFSTSNFFAFFANKFFKNSKNLHFLQINFMLLQKLGDQFGNYLLSLYSKLVKINNKNEYDKKDTYNARQFYNCFWYNSGNPEEGIFVENNNANIVNMFDYFEFYCLQI